MDIFTKCYQHSFVDELRERDLFPYFRELQSRQDTEVIMEGKRRIMLGSNNYLGLTTNPEIIAAAHKALDEYGTGCSGSRLLNGTLNLHLAFEREMAEFLRKGDVVTFSTGFQSNLGIISAIVGMRDYMICDRENHASIYDACRLSYGKMLRYRHSDMADLERCLQKVPEDRAALIITDGVFSMGGDIAKLPEITTLAKKYGARVMVDDAHAFGVIGEGAAAARRHSVWSRRSTSTWARSPSRWPRSAAIWRRMRACATTSAAIPGRTSFRRVFRPRISPSPRRRCAT